MNQQLRDIIHILQYVTEKIPPKDSVRAAMNRLIESVTTDHERSLQALVDLKAKRSVLLQQRGEIEHQKQHTAYFASQPDADAAAKQRATDARDRYTAHLAELASIEAAIAKREAA